MKVRWLSRSPTSIRGQGGCVRQDRVEVGLPLVAAMCVHHCRDEVSPPGAKRGGRGRARQPGSAHGAAARCPPGGRQRFDRYFRNGDRNDEFGRTRCRTIRLRAAALLDQFLELVRGGEKKLFLKYRLGKGGNLGGQAMLWIVCVSAKEPTITGPISWPPVASSRRSQRSGLCSVRLWRCHAVA